MLLMKDREKLKAHKFFAMGRCGLLREQIKAESNEEEKKKLVRELNRELHKIRKINKQLQCKLLETKEVEMW